MARETVTIDEIPSPDLDMQFRVLTTPILKYFTNLVRSSYEYKLYIQFLKNVLDVNKCSYYEGYSMENGLTIEAHHSPFTLYDICEAVAKRQFEENDGYVEAFSVGEEVTRLHFEFKVGLVPLNPTAHELVHSGELFIHPDIVLGDWKRFEAEYRTWFSEEAKVKYLDLIEFTKDPTVKAYPKILEKNEIILSVKGLESLKSIDIGKFIAATKTKQYLTDSSKEH